VQKENNDIPLLIVTSVNLVHNAPRLSVTGPAFRPTGPDVGGGGGRGLLQTDSTRHSRISTDRAWCGRWGRERSVTDKPGPALPNFNRPGLAWGVGEGKVCYRQTRPRTPGFQPTGLGVGGGGGRGLLQTDSARHSRIST